MFENIKDSKYSLKEPVTVCIECSGTICGIKTVDGVKIYSILTDAGRVINDLLETDLQLSSEQDEGTPSDSFDESMDGDHASALASAGMGTDEDYGDYGGDRF